MNRTLNSLEERGHVLRTPSPDDARKVLVDLTPAARDLIAETRRLRAEWFSAHLDVLTEDGASAAARRSRHPAQAGGFVSPRPAEASE